MENKSNENLKGGVRVSVLPLSDNPVVHRQDPALSNPYNDNDKKRFSKQEPKVLNVLQDYKPHTLAEISKLTGIKEGSIASRIRDLRVKRNKIVRTRKEGIHYYTLCIAEYTQDTLF